MNPFLHRYLAGCMALALNILPVPTNLVAAIVESVPVANWKFDELSGSVATDSSSNGHSGIIVGAVRTSGKIGGALFFDGAGDYVFASDAQSGGTSEVGLDIGTRDWTAAAWVQTTNSGMVLTKMGFIGGSNPDGWGLSVSGNGTVGAVLHKSGGATVNIFSGDGATV